MGLLNRRNSTLRSGCEGLISFIVAITLEPKTEKRLEALAKRVGRSKAFFARQAIEEHLGELEDGYIALARLKKPARRHTSAEVRRELGL